MSFNEVHRGLDAVADGQFHILREGCDTCSSKHVNKWSGEGDWYFSVVADLPFSERQVTSQFPEAFT